jgi:glycolate oxidase
VPYECDGLTAYRQMPLAVALPETEAQVAAVLKACHRCRCRWWRAAPAPA